MSRFLLYAAALGGFLSVVFGAFAAHGLKNYIDAYSLSIWQTGVQYQMYHAWRYWAWRLLIFTARENP